MEENKNQADGTENNSWGITGNPSDEQKNSWSGQFDASQDQSGGWNSEQSVNQWDQTQLQWSAQQGYDQSQNGYQNQSGYGYGNEQNPYGQPQNEYQTTQSNFDQSQNGYTNQYGYDLSQNGYQNQFGYGYDANQNVYSQPQNGYDMTQSQNGYDMTQNQTGYNNQYGYDMNQTGYQNQGGYGYDTNQTNYGMNGYPQNPYMNTNNEPPKKKKGLVIGIIAGAFVVVAAIIGFVLIGGKDKLPKKLENFKYSSSVTFDDFLDAYYDGEKKSFEKSAKEPNYEKLLSKPDNYINDTFEIMGYVTSVEDDSLYYVSADNSNVEEYYCYNAAGKKGAVEVGDYVDLYAIFTQLSEDETYPCMVVWECEQVDAPASAATMNNELTVAESETEQTNETEASEVVGEAEEEAEIPDIEYTAEEQALIDHLEVTQLYGREASTLFYYVENMNQNQYSFSMYMYVNFYDKDDNLISSDYTYLSFDSYQPYEFGTMYCMDDDYNSIEFEYATYYFDDISQYGFEETCYYEYLDAELTQQDDYTVSGTITNISGVTLDVNGYVVFYDEEGYIIDYDSFWVDDVNESAEFEVYFWEYDEHEISTYDIFWSSIYDG